MNHGWAHDALAADSLFTAKLSANVCRVFVQCWFSNYFWLRSHSFSRRLGSIVSRHRLLRWSPWALGRGWSHSCWVTVTIIAGTQDWGPSPNPTSTQSLFLTGLSQPLSFFFEFPCITSYRCWDSPQNWGLWLRFAIVVLLLLLSRSAYLVGVLFKINRLSRQQTISQMCNH